MTERAPGVHSDLPEEPAERAVAGALIAASAGRWQLWFNLQRNSNEMDDLVLAPDVGAFCIEVKGWKVTSLREYTDDHVVTGSGRKIHPLKQAQAAMHGLMSHLDERGIAHAEKPFFYSTAAFPWIRRTEMYEECGNEFSRHFEGMIFAEDLLDPDSLGKRLIRIGDYPPLGVGRRRSFPRSNQIQAVTRILNRKVVLKWRPAATGMAEVFAEIHEAAQRPPSPQPRKVDRPPTAEERRRALRTPGVSRRNGISRVVFHGKAGTGKTTELLKVALAHALAGRLTLVCCYTKVLAAELRARMQQLPGFTETGATLMVVHLDQLRSTGEDAIGFGGFQTICVDEAQDVAQDRFDELVALAAQDAEWFLSDAPEQAIYDQRSPFLDDAVEVARRNGTWEPKRVGLRSGIAERLVADAALEIAPDVGRIARWVAAHPIRSGELDPDDEQEALDLKVPVGVAGTLPEIVRLPADGGWDARVAAYEAILADELSRSRRSNTDLDLAVVSMRREGMSDEWKKVRAALGRLRLPYLDQIDTANRRRSPAVGEVRLATVHSIRGVDANRVVLLDIEGIEALPEADRPAFLNIAVSRARDGTTIVLRPDPPPGAHYRRFIEELVHAYTPAATGRDS